MKNTNTSPKQQSGFTIIELMIATVISTIILLILTVALIQITNSYYKGLTINKTQNAARDILNTVGQSIQFGASSAITVGSSSGVSYVCTSSQEFAYQPGVEQTTSSGIIFGAKPLGSCTASLSMPLPAGTWTPLLGNNMRLAKLTVSQSSPGSNLWNIDIRVVYGDDPLLCSPSVSGSCSSGGSMPSGPDYQEPDLTCKTGAGSQFCAASELTTTVAARGSS